jgi:hypothetical protein
MNKSTEHNLTYVQSSQKALLKHAWAVNIASTTNDHDSNIQSFVSSDGYIPIIFSSDLPEKSSIGLTSATHSKKLIATSFSMAGLAGARSPSKATKSKQSALKFISSRAHEREELKQKLKKTKYVKSKKEIVKMISSVTRKLNRKGKKPSTSRLATKLTNNKMLSRAINLDSSRTKVNLIRISQELSTHDVATTLPNLLPKRHENGLFVDSNNLSEIGVLTKASPALNLVKLHNRLTPNSLTNYCDSNVYPNINVISNTMSSFRPSRIKDLNFYPDVTP